MLAMFVAAQNYFTTLFEDRDEGQGMVEYVLILGVISIGVIIAFQTTELSTAIKGLSDDIVAYIQ